MSSSHGLFSPRPTTDTSQFNKELYTAYVRPQQQFIENICAKLVAEFGFLKQLIRKVMANKHAQGFYTQAHNLSGHFNGLVSSSFFKTILEACPADKPDPASIKKLVIDTQSAFSRPYDIDIGSTCRLLSEIEFHLMKISADKQIEIAVVLGNSYLDKITDKQSDIALTLGSAYLEKLKAAVTAESEVYRIPAV